MMAKPKASQTRPAAARKKVNIALQGGGAHGAFSWGALDALLEDERIEIAGISGASAGAMNAVVLAEGMINGGRDGARKNLRKFWLSVSDEGYLSAPQRELFDAYFGAFRPDLHPALAWMDSLSNFGSPYEFNPLNLNPLRDHLTQSVDFAKLRAGPATPKLFIAATNVHTGKGEIFSREILTADHVMASACLPRIFQAVMIGDTPYWDGGFAGNPPLWPLFYQTQCLDTIIVQINPIARYHIPKTAREIADRVNEITFNSGLLAELRAADFVRRLIDDGILKSARYRRENIHRIGGDGALEGFSATTKLDVSWNFLQRLRDLGREAAKNWLAQNYAAIGVRSTLDIPATLER